MLSLTRLLRRLGLTGDSRRTHGLWLSDGPLVSAGVTVVGRTQVRPFNAQVRELSEEGFSLLVTEGAAGPGILKEGCVLGVIIVLPNKIVTAYTISAHTGTEGGDAAAGVELIGARITQMSAEDREALSAYLCVSGW